MAQHPPRNDSPARRCAKRCELLHAGLAPAFAGTSRVMPPHASLKGPNLKAERKRLGKLHAGREQQLDELTERITALVGVREGAGRDVTADLFTGRATAADKGQWRMEAPLQAYA